ncbi:condensin complex subunit 1 [Cimex lectularius]|uniref:Condensin complex subunit 1 n=1 Tax=Cimex lectularius TaxID=79782 RepID=A0A8I6RXI5_CIMLE|nr:condensin complex subunit 1 [Cimex lectularius]
MDEEWDFMVPLQKEDLQKEESGQYVVREVYSSAEAFKRLKDVKKDLKNKNCPVILKQFDSVYSIFCDNEITILQLQEVFDSVIEHLVSTLRDYVEDALNFDDPSEKRQAVNVIKMVFYLFFLFIKTYEEKLAVNADNNIPEPKRMKGMKSKVNKNLKPEDLWDWGGKKKSIFVAMYPVLEARISCLWPDTVADVPFVNMIGNCCYKAYENPDIAQAKMKPLANSIAHILSILVMHYNYGLTFTTKAIQLIKYHEHVASAISSTIITMVTEYKLMTVLPKLLKELVDSVSGGEGAGLDKAISTLITDLAENEPDLLIPSVNILLKNLTVEPYAIRNATLVAFAEIILYIHGKQSSATSEEKEMKMKLFELLHNHIRDQNSYVRSKVLQLWVKLAAQRAVPMDVLLPVLQTTKGRLNDKSCFTVKNAILFFTTALKENPYAGKLNIVEIQNELVKEKLELQALSTKLTISLEDAWRLLEGDLILALTNHFNENEDEELTELPSTQSVSVKDVMLIIKSLIQEKHFVDAYNLLKQSEVQFPTSKEIRCNLETVDKVEYYKVTFKKIFMNTNDKSDTLTGINFSDEYEKQQSIVSYNEETYKFTHLITEASKDIEKVLKVKNQIEMVEAIDFFTTAFQFGIADSRRVVRSILTLVHCDVSGIKDAVTNAYKTLYLYSSKPTPKMQAIHVAQRLIKLIKELDMMQKLALGELMSQWMTNNDLNKQFIQVLWEKFAVQDNQNVDNRIAALMLLDLMANHNNSLVASNIPVLIEFGLSDETTNLAIVEYTCSMIGKYGLTKSEGKYIRLYSDNAIFDKAVNCLVANFNKFPSKGYIPMSIAIINMVFKLCCYPEKVTDKILISLYNKMFEMDNNSNLGTNESQENEDRVIYNESLLKRLLHIYSEIIFRKFIYLEKDVLTCLKKSKTTHDNDHNSDSDDEDEKLYRQDNEEAAAEHIVSSTQQICEHLINDSSTLEFHLKELVVKICKNFNSDTVKISIDLLSSATVALAKLMMVSQNFCKQHIQLFITMMTKSKHNAVRQILVLGFGDILMRYPNVVEPWSQHIYSRLKDPSTSVRKNVVIILKHLIQRQMIKARGQMSELCLCLEDSDTSIAEMVQSLLIDLSQQGNSLYNIIPDIISRLVNREEPIEDEVFKRIMKFILKLISKERQSEQIIEKICIRMRETNVESQWRNLAFCLNQLSFNEKSLRKLCDIIPHFKERLMCKEVYNSIVAIFNTANKSVNKPQLKEIANEGLDLIDDLITYKDGSKKKTQAADEDADGNDNEDVFCTPRKPIPSITPRKTRTRNPKSAKKAR